MPIRELVEVSGAPPQASDNTLPFAFLNAHHGAAPGSRDEGGRVVSSRLYVSWKGFQGHQQALLMFRLLERKRQKGQACVLSLQLTWEGRGVGW